MESAFVRKYIGHKLAKQQQNEAKVDHPDAHFFARPGEPGEMRAQEVDQQHTPDEIASGKNRNFPTSSFRPPINEETAELFVLRFIQTQIDLRQCTDENQHQTKSQANHRQLQRAKESDEIEIMPFSGSGRVSLRGRLLLRSSRRRWDLGGETGSRCCAFS